MDDLSYLAETLVFSKTLILMQLASGRRAVVRRGFLQVCVCMCMFSERKGVIWGYYLWLGPNSVIFWV